MSSTQLEKRPEARPNGAAPPPMTEEEFVAWCDEDTRAEWVGGDVVMMSPANDEHIDLHDWLVGVLRFFAEEHDLGKVRSELQVRLAKQKRRRTPDLVFVAKDRTDLMKRMHLEGAPDLVVEIVSPDNVARDWREKYLEYQAAGVREYWVIDPAQRRVEAYVLPAGRGARRRYARIEEAEGVLRSTVLPGFFLRTTWLWSETRPRLSQAFAELGLMVPAPKPWRKRRD